MPIYEYQCTACGHQLEAFQKMSEDALKNCPECHQETLQKLISAAGFQLKGTGWYATDFRNKGKPEAAKSTGSDSTETKTPATKTTDTKTPETKTTATSSSSKDTSSGSSTT